MESIKRHFVSDSEPAFILTILARMKELEKLNHDLENTKTRLEKNNRILRKHSANLEVLVQRLTDMH
jgi:uncharacterized membrane-anchored protein YhcB (DUF1043 family)